MLLQNPQWSNWLTGNDWGSVFLVNVPIVIVGLIAIIRVVPETKDPNPRRLDLQGLALSVIGLTALIYGIIHASSTKSWLDLGVVIPVLAGLAIIALFLFLEARSDHSSFDVTLFRNRGYAVSLVAVSLAFFALSGITFTLPFYLQILRGYDTLIAGLCFVPFAIGQIIAAPSSAKTVLRFGYRKVMTGGLILVTLALVGLVFLQLDTPIWLLLVVFFIFGLGMGNVIAPASTVMQNVLPLARAGAGSAVQNTVRQVGGALGVAIIGTVLATQYAANLKGTLTQLPPQFPEAAKQAASESVIATMGVLNQAEAGGLPASIANSVREAAYADFLTASHLASLISLVVVFIATLVVGFGLPHITPLTKKIEMGAGPAPVDAADAMVETEAADYRGQAQGEYPTGKEQV